MMWRAVIVFWITFGIHWCAEAQYVSRLGRFEVDQVKGCAPFTITVTIIPPFICDNANPCDMFYEDDTPEAQTFTHTYNTPGTFLLRILFQTTGFDDISITVTPDTPPVFDVYTCGNNEVSVKLNDTNYDEYVIDYNDGSPVAVVDGSATNNHTYSSSTPQTVTVRGRDLGAADNCSEGGIIITPLLALPAPTITLLEVLNETTIRLEFDGQPNIQYKLGIATNNATTFQQVKTIYNPTANTNNIADTLFNLRTDDNYYCFQIAAFDPCNNVALNSSTICSANLDLSVRNNAIDVSWTTSNPGGAFRLTRRAADGTVLINNPPSSPHADVDITCGMEYCYQLRSTYANGSQSFSLTKCETGFSTDTPTAIQNVTAVAGDNSVVLEWQNDPAFTPAEYSVNKSIGGNYAVLGTTTQNALADPEYRVEDASCYRINYRDVCDNQSPPGIEACPIRLSGNLQKDNAISLTWTPYLGWTNGVSGYTVEKYAEDGQLLQTFQVGNNTSYVDESDDLDFQSFVYVVRANAVQQGLGQSVSNRISLLKDPNLFHPTAFTPNGDNLNDNFTVFGQYITSFDMQVFNRWGELLFTTDDINSGWDGTFRGNDMPEGTYTFIAHITDRAGRTFKRSGSVLLLRK